MEGEKYQFIENPVVGKFYDVPCMQSVLNPRRFVAVLPHKHSDPQFGNRIAALEHFHFDTRFWAKSDFELFTETDLQEGRVANVNLIEGFPAYNNEVRILRRKCHRLFTGFLFHGQEIGNRAKQWYRQQIGKSCAGRICPHFRQPMLERDGVLECPYHGLIGDIKTEKIIGNIHGV